MLLVSAPSASGASWDSAHEPAVLANPAISAQEYGYSFRVSVSFAALTPAVQHAVPVTVTFSDPSGASSTSVSPSANEPCLSHVTVEDHEKGEGSCSLASWTAPVSSGTPDFAVSTFAADSLRSFGSGLAERSAVDLMHVELAFAPSTVYVERPFLYEVSDPEGVIARGALTATQYPAETVRGHVLSPCLNSGHGLRSEGGELSCEQTLGGVTSYQAGWPAPPAGKPAPSLTAADARSYLRMALENKAAGTHRRLGVLRAFVGRCRRVSSTRFRCSPSFTARDIRWSGTAQIWLPEEVEWDYSLALRGRPSGCRGSSCVKTLIVH
ncbi:MAG TPA: hypothetical protein VGL57_15135 [Solirubrobacteraceae bacterium]|jgi:hypothetical protein